MFLLQFFEYLKGGFRPSDYSFRARGHVESIPRVLKPLGSYPQLEPLQSGDLSNRCSRGSGRWDTYHPLPWGAPAPWTPRPSCNLSKNQSKIQAPGLGPGARARVPELTTLSFARVCGEGPGPLGSGPGSRAPRPSYNMRKNQNQFRAPGRGLGPGPEARARGTGPGSRNLLQRTDEGFEPFGGPKGPKTLEGLQKARS